MRYWTLFTVLFALLMIACNPLAPPTATPTAVKTVTPTKPAAASTPTRAVATAPAIPSPTAPPIGPVGAQTAAPVPTPQSVQTGTTPPVSTRVTGCTDHVRYVSDVTIPDGSVFKPGEGFVKTWRLTNDGTCPWTSGYALVFAGGERLEAAELVPLAKEVQPNETVDVSIPMKAPTAAGSYTGRWNLANANGHTLGSGPDGKGMLWVQVQVGQ